MTRPGRIDGAVSKSTAEPDSLYDFIGLVFYTGWFVVAPASI